jgi:hypothetical protein
MPVVLASNDTEVLSRVAWRVKEEKPYQSEG